MKKVTVLFLAVCLQTSFAQTTKRDGNWLKNGLDAFDRVFVTQNANEQDANAGLTLMSYVSGMLAVHRQNNLGALVLAYALNSSPQKPLSETDRAKIQTAFLFVPLLKVPDDLSPQQVTAILRKFLAQNPARWSESADKLITDAFAVEFPLK